MRPLDDFSVFFVTALVVNVSGAMFLIETLLRRSDSAGRVWALSFMSSMLMTVAYVIWAVSENVWWAVMIGNAAVVAAAGCLWLGCRRFNGRSMRWSGSFVVVACLAAAVAVMVDSAHGEWAGAAWMFVPTAIFAASGAIECARGELAANRTAWVLVAVLTLQALYFGVRTVVFLAAGYDSVLFEEGFSTALTGLLTVTVTIVSVVTTSVLRAARAPVRGYLRVGSARSTRNAVLTPHEFETALADLCTRAERRGELVGVVAVTVGDLDEIATAFGVEVARAVTDAWRDGVHRHAPSNAFLGDDGAQEMTVGVLVASAADARREAGAIYGGLFDELGEVSGSVIPILGVGVALSETVGYDASALVSSARSAAARATETIEDSVFVADVDVS